MRIVRPHRKQLSGSSREVERTYDGRFRRYDAAHRHCVRRSEIWSAIRLALFALASVSLLVSFRANSMNPWGYFGVACVMGFIGAVFQHLRLQTKALYLQTLATLNAEAGYKLHRRWCKIRPTEPVEISPIPVELTDLHIVGEGSLMHWLNTIVTAGGKQRLIDWLGNPGSSAEIKRRQAAVNELSPELDARQEFYATSDRVREVSDDDTGLLRWAQDRLDPMLPYGVVLLLSIGTVAAVLVEILGFTSVHWWLPVVLTNVALSMRYSRSIRNELDLVDRANTRLSCYSALIRQAIRQPHHTSLLSGIQRQLHFVDVEGTTTEPVNRLVDQLQRRVSMAELRHFGLYYIFAQSLFLWDFHCIRALRGWRARYGQCIKGWLDALASYEVLCTVASIRHDQPDWCFPDLEADGLTFRAVGLGHPLISEHNRVCNDVEIGPDRRLLLLSGSNMSGKSTLLRTIGCNIILARCGAPVCGAEVQCQPTHVLSSFHVEDSLTDGTSLFMAELMRMKHIVSAAERNTEQRMTTLYLLDEILHGTNSHERRIAVTVILESLLGFRTLGVISTHDLELAGNQELRAQSAPFHFREYIEHVGDELVMRFDYRLRKGEATSTNALVLLKAIGIKEKPLTTPSSPR